MRKTVDKKRKGLAPVEIYQADSELLTKVVCEFKALDRSLNLPRTKTQMVSEFFKKHFKVFVEELKKDAELV